jgi:outer membrane receptor for ferrienterochelin and colicins
MGSGCFSHRRHWAMLCLGAQLLAACAMLGQDSSQSSNDLADSSLEELMNVEVYSASKHLQGLRQAPSFVSIVTAEDIRTYGYRTLAEILQSIPGFYTTYDYQYSNLGVRGFLETSGYSTPPYLLLVDGHRINDAIFEDAPIGRELPLDVDLIERVEVIRGPSSSLYGANAVFGVINIVTRRGRDVGTEVSAEGGSFGTGKGRVSYGHTFQRWEVLVSGSFYGSAGETLFFPEFDTPQTNNGIARGLDGESADDFFVKVSHGHFTFQGVYGIRDKDIPTAAFSFAFDDPREKSTDEGVYGDLSYDRSFGPWAVAGQISLDHYRFNETIPYPGGSPTENITNLLGEWWGAEVKISRAVLEKHLLTGGLEFRDNFHQNLFNYNIAPSTTYLAADRSSTVWALYLQDEYSITSKLSLNLAVRHDHYSSFMATDPRLAVIFHPWEHTSFKVVAGKAFRAPSAYELYFASPLNEANPYLHGETVRSGEAIVEQALGRQFQMTVCAFHNDMQGLITSGTDPSNGLAVLTNNDSVLTRGVEAQLEGKLSRGISARASYTFADAQDRFSPLPLPNSPRNLAKFNLSAPVFRRWLFAGWESQYTSARYTLAGNTLGGFAITNLTLSTRNLGKHANLSLSAYNLFDKKYSQPGGPQLVQDSLQQPGRSLRAKMEYRF